MVKATTSDAIIQNSIGNSIIIINNTTTNETTNIHINGKIKGIIEISTILQNTLFSSIYTAVSSNNRLLVVISSLTLT